MPEFEILSVNISTKKGTVKEAVEEIQIDKKGIKNDAHAGDWNRQLSFLGIESIKKFEKQAKRKMQFGEFAENLTTKGIDLPKVKPLDKLFIGKCVLEITQIGKHCHGDKCAIYTEVGNCIMPKEGVFARVIKTGSIKAGDVGVYEPKVIKACVITMSDRASSGVYEDRSGVLIADTLSDYFDKNQRKFSVSRQVIPDDAEMLTTLVTKEIKKQTDIVFTCGGTGIGPRDITPETLLPLIEKQLPGIMEMVRMKFGAEKPNALLSRSVAGISQNTLIFALPGSVNAVKEYMSVIIPLLQHAIYMKYGLDIH
ncbi:MAG: molybdenum cofactor synthesis domain-containing protein [Bacteroidota bacterium]